VALFLRGSLKVEEARLKEGKCFLRKLGRILELKFKAADKEGTVKCAGGNVQGRREREKREYE